MTDGWEGRLNNYIDGVRHEQFSWGIHDCFTFTNEAVRAMTGEGYGDDWAGRYLTATGKPKTLRMIQKEYGFDTLASALDSRLECLSGPTYPRGSIVTCQGLSENNTTGHALGISVGARSVFIGKDGLQFLPSDMCERGWTCHH